MYISPLKSDPSMKYHSLTFRNLPLKKSRRILKAASKEFSNSGYKSANINVIAKNSDVSVGSLYKYFGSKQNLYLLTLATGIYPFRVFIEGILTSEQPLDKKMEQLLSSMQRIGKSYGNRINLYLELIVARSNNLLPEVINEIELLSANAYKTLLIKGQEAGQIRKDLHPQLGAFYLDNFCKTLLVSYSTDYFKERFRAYTFPNILDQDEFVVQESLKFILSALAPD